MNTFNQRACVYILESQGLYKIGKAANLSARLAGLQAGNPTELKVIAVIATEAYEVLERALHRLYASQRVRGEWFQLNQGDIEFIKATSVVDFLRMDLELEKQMFKRQKIETNADWPRYDVWTTIQKPPRFITPMLVLDQTFESDVSVSKTVALSFTLIFSLAWESNYTQTPPLNEEELQQFVRLSRRQYIEHKQGMEQQLGWCRSEHPAAGLVKFFFPFEFHVAEE